MLFEEEMAFASEVGAGAFPLRAPAVARDAFGSARTGATGVFAADFAATFVGCAAVLAAVFVAAFAAGFAAFAAGFAADCEAALAPGLAAVAADFTAAFAAVFEEAFEMPLEDAARDAIFDAILGVPLDVALFAFAAARAVEDFAVLPAEPERAGALLVRPTAGLRALRGGVAAVDFDLFGFWGTRGRDGALRVERRLASAENRAASGALQDTFWTAFRQSEFLDLVSTRR